MFCNFFEGNFFPTPQKNVDYFIRENVFRIINNRIYRKYKYFDGNTHITNVVNIDLARVDTLLLRQCRSHIKTHISEKTS